MRADMDGWRWLAEPLRLPDDAHRFAPSLWVQSVDEEDSIKVVGLVLNATRQQVAALDDDRLPVHVHSLGYDTHRALRVESEPGKGEAPLFAILYVGREVEVGVDEVADIIIDPVGEDPEGNANLGSRETGARCILHCLGQILHELAQLLVEGLDGGRWRTKDGIAHKSDRLNGHNPRVSSRPSNPISPTIPSRPQSHLAQNLGEINETKRNRPRFIHLAQILGEMNGGGCCGGS